MVVIIPALVGIITLLVIMINFNESYNEAVKNVSVASKFNFSFSEDMDYKMYRIVIGAESFDAMKPYEEIKEAKELVKELNKNAVLKPVTTRCSPPLTSPWRSPVAVRPPCIPPLTPAKTTCGLCWCGSTAQASAMPKAKSTARL